MKWYVKRFLRDAEIINALILGFLAVVLLFAVDHANAGSPVIWPGKVLSPQLQAKDGTVTAPGYAFASNAGSGIYQVATNEMAIATNGVQVLDLLYQAAGQVNIGFGIAAVGGATNPFNANRTTNGNVTFNWSNQSTGSASATSFTIADGPSSNYLSLENHAYDTTAYITGGSIIRSNGNQTQLIISSEYSGAFTAFTIGGTTAAAEVLRIDSTKHIMFHDSTLPTVGTCGTSPTVTANSTDNAGQVTVGTGGSSSACTITFAHTWGTAPVCNFESDTDMVAHKVVTTTTTAIVTFASNYTASSKLSYRCAGFR
jgi:hypothetical protein